ncbi:MAG TPA: PAS domain-containing protein [Actinomycetota bacterium]
MSEGASRRNTLQQWSEALLFRSLVEQVPAVVYVDANELRPESLYVSPQCLELFGCPAEAILEDGDLWRRSIHPEDRARVDATWAAAFERQARFEAEYRWIRPDGRAVWVHDSAVLVRGRDGEPLFWQGILFDVTESKGVEEALRQSEEHYRFLVENIPAIVYQVAPDDDRRTLYVGPHVERALGYSRREWLDQPDMWMELLHPDDREPTLAAHDRHNESGEPWSREYRLIASDGRAVWIRDVANLIRHHDGLPKHWLGVQLDITALKHVEERLRGARDELGRRVLERSAELEEANELMSLEISERRRAEQELRTTEHRYRVLAENIPAVAYIWQVESHPDEPRSYTSPRIEQLLGYTVDEWHRTSDFWMSRLHPDDRTAVIAATLRSEATGERFSMEYRYLAKDGNVVWVLDEAALLTRDASGNPELFQGVMIDITARKQAEAKANETELRFRSLAEQLPAIIYVVDVTGGKAGDVTYVSPQLTTILGYTHEDWRTTDEWLETVHPEDRNRVRQLAVQAHNSAERYLIEYRVVHRDGGLRWVRDRGVALSRDDAGRPRELQGFIVDITAARRAEEELREAEARYRSLVEQMPAVTSSSSRAARRARPSSRT